MRRAQAALVVVPFLPTILADQHLINSNIIPGAQDILDIFLENHTSGHDVFDILSHGCWCKALDQHNEDLTGGDAFDAIDRLCKEWKAKRICNSGSTGTCHGVSSSDYYTLDYSSSSSFTCTDDDTCLLDTCRVDSYYSDRILQLLGLNNDWQPDTNVACNPAGQVNSSNGNSSSGGSSSSGNGNGNGSGSNDASTSSGESTENTSCLALSPDLSEAYDNTISVAAVPPVTTTQPPTTTHISFTTTDVPTTTNIGVTTTSLPETTSNSVDDTITCPDGYELNNGVCEELLENLYNSVYESENLGVTVGYTGSNRRRRDTVTDSDTNENYIYFENPQNEYNYVFFRKDNVQSLSMRCPYGDCLVYIGFVNKLYCQEDSSNEDYVNTCEEAMNDPGEYPPGHILRYSGGNNPYSGMVVADSEFAYLTETYRNIQNRDGTGSFMAAGDTATISYSGTIFTLTTEGNSPITKDLDAYNDENAHDLDPKTTYYPFIVVMGANSNYPDRVPQYSNRIEITAITLFEEPNEPACDPSCDESDVCAVDSSGISNCQTIDTAIISAYSSILNLNNHLVDINLDIPTETITISKSPDTENRHQRNIFFRQEKLTSLSVHCPAGECSYWLAFTRQERCDGYHGERAPPYDTLGQNGLKCCILGFG